MNYFNVIDLIEDQTEAIIISHETTVEEIQEIFDTVKKEKPGAWGFDDIIERLPTDCDFININDMQVITD